jgi:beta-lactamase regulating signal transducer with metallopeptidase domain
VLWRQLLAGDIAWPRVLPLMLWVLLFVGRAVVAGIARREDQAALTRSARCGRRTRFGDSNVTLVPDLGTPAVTVGVLRASVIVDALFWAEAAESERRVVVAHEVAHLRGRHGLVEWMSRALIAPLLPLPVAGDIYDCVRRHLEALADDAAVRQHGRRAVGEALSAIALARTPVGGLGAAGDCVWRVRRLVAPARKRSWKDLAIFVPLVAMMAIGVMGATADAAAALGPVAQADVCAI